MPQATGHRHKSADGWLSVLLIDLASVSIPLVFSLNKKTVFLSLSHSPNNILTLVRPLDELHHKASGCL